MQARDYKQRPAPRAPARKKTRPVSAWTWFGFGICVGALSTIAVFVYEPRISIPDLIPGDIARQAKAPVKPRFEFYTVLPEKEIAVPETAIVEIAEQPSVPLKKPVAGTRYLLQVGSFRKLPDAERLKARLAFMGLDATIQTVTIDGAETWHRVRIGPYGKINQLKSVLAQLKKNRLDSIVLKLRN